MSKQREIAAFNRFIEKVRQIQVEDGASYFDELVTHADVVRRNILDDFPAFTFIFVPQQTHEQLRQELETMKKDAEVFDVRKIHGKLADAEAELRAAEQQIADGAAARDEARATIDEMTQMLRHEKVEV